MVYCRGGSEGQCVYVEGCGEEGAVVMLVGHLVIQRTVSVAT